MEKSNSKVRFVIESEAGETKTVYIDKKVHHDVMFLYELAGKEYSLSTKSFLLKHRGDKLDQKSTTPIESILKDGSIVQLEMLQRSLPEEGFWPRGCTVRVRGYDDERISTREARPRALPAAIAMNLVPPPPPPEEPPCREITYEDAQR